MPLCQKDTFGDSTIDTARWNITGAGVTESAGKLNITGNGAWNSNGIVSVKSSTGSKFRAYFKLTAPATLDGSKDALFGFSKSATLSFVNAYTFLVQIDANWTPNIRIRHSSGNYETTGSVAAATTYEFRMTVNGANAAVEIKGGAYADWTTIYSSTGYTNPSSGAFFHAQALDASVTYSFDDIEVWEPGLRFFVTSDNFDDNSVNSALWNTVGAGVSESGQKLSVTGSGAWNANGVHTKKMSGGSYAKAEFDITTPSSIGSNQCLIGFSNVASGLSYQNNGEFLLQFTNDLLLRYATSYTDTTYNTEASTTYNVRMTYDGTGATVSAIVEMRGGQFADWTTVYTNAAYPTSPLQARFQFQVLNAAYTIDNLVLTEPIGQYDYDIVGIGDSICVGQGGGGTTIYNRLEALAPQRLTLNKGVGGNTTDDVLARFANDAISVYAEKIYLTAGTNDYYFAAPDYAGIADNLASMLALCQAATPARTLVLGEVPPVTTRTPPSGLTIEQMQEATKKINAIYRKFALDNGLAYCPSYQEIAHLTAGATDDDIAAAYNSDGVHFTASGYSRIGDMYYVAALPTRILQWGDAAYGVDDESWKWWVLGGASISGNADTGTLVLPQNQYAASTVKALESGEKQITITPTVASGSVVIKYRTSANNFNRDSAAAWSTYTGLFVTEDEFIQIRLDGASVADANVSDVSLAWSIDQPLSSSYDLRSIPRGVMRGVF